MKIKIKYFANVRDLTGKSEDIIILEKKTSVQKMLSYLISIYGNDFKRNVCTSEGLLNNDLIFLLNGKIITHNNLSSKILKEGDIAAIMPPVGGG